MALRPNPQTTYWEGEEERGFKVESRNCEKIKEALIHAIVTLMNQMSIRTGALYRCCYLAIISRKEFTDISRVGLTSPFWFVFVFLTFVTFELNFYDFFSFFWENSKHVDDTITFKFVRENVTPCESEL